jgi:alpha-1,2-mannosyltransferase
VDSSTPIPFPGLRRWQRLGLVALVLALIGFGIVVEVRSAFLKRPMTDLQVYLRAAWAVRTGADLYAVVDDNLWHYHYPPLFAILLTPLADAPRDAAPLTAPVPFAVSVALVYVLSVVCLWLSVHWLANAIEAASGMPPPPRYSRRWWTLRVLPALVCLPGAAATLVRGQVNLFLLALLCAMAAAALRGRSWRAGFWLAAAICLKLIPAYLLIYPLWRRDVRWLAGCAIGLVVGLGVIPAAVLGPGRTVACYQEWCDVLIRPALGRGNDQSRAKELIEATATDSQSFVVLMHNALHMRRFLREGKPPLRDGLDQWLNWERATRPAQPAAETRLAHWMLGGFLTGLTLLASGWRRPDQLGMLLGLGGLVLLMPLLSPVCHLHYFCLAVPLVLGLIVSDWDRPGRERRGSRIGIGLALLFGVNVIGNILPRFAGLEVLRDLGLVTCVSLLLWLAAVVVLFARRATARPALAETVRPGEGRAAA